MDNLLGVLGRRYNTEFITTHKLHFAYHDILQKLREQNFNMFTIGIDKFRSLDMWKVYFPLAKIYGLDSQVEYKDERLCIYRGNESKIESILNQMRVRCDFIFDDEKEHSLAIFDTLFQKLLLHGGVYCINYPQPETLLTFQQVVNAMHNITPVTFLSSQTFNAISSITFANGCIIIKKKTAFE
jgi:hypothetical protein